MIAQEPPGSEAATAPLLPPRPIPEPEPWPEPSGFGTILGFGLFIGLVAVLLLSHWWWRRRRRRQPGATVDDGPTIPDNLDALSPRDRLVARAETLREALVGAFGPSWAARTTEEIAEAAEPADRLGPDRARGLVALLAAADRAKFAGSDDQSATGPDSIGDDAWVALVVADLADGARSSSNGR